MKLILIFTGKTQEAYIKEGLGMYLDRLKHYLPVEIMELKPPSFLSGLKGDTYRQKESDWLIQNLPETDFLVLLDESGKQLSSEGLAVFLQGRMNQGTRQLTFLVGGAYGFSDKLKQKGNLVLSLSLMTFTHQMTRIILAEQLYRAMTILKGEPYHNP